MPNNIAIAKLQDKSVSVTSNGSHTISPDQGYTGLHRVSLDVNVQEPGLIKFYDFDGTLVASYTGEEVQALSALPNAPDHSTDAVPLTFDGWNWPLADIKAYNTSYPTVNINVGAYYYPTDGKSHFYFKNRENSISVKIRINFHNNGDTIDWGDGSVEEISGYELTHTYTSVGEFHCIVNNTMGAVVYYKIGDSNGTSESLTKMYLASNVTSSGESFYKKCTSLEIVVIPKSMSMARGFFQECYSLKAIILPIFTNSHSIPQECFRNCYNLKMISIPSTFTYIDKSAFSSCYSLESITIPSGVTSIDDSAFAYCDSFKSLTIPSGVTNIGSSAFSTCSNLKYINVLGSITTFGQSAFANCKTLQSIVFSSGTTTIGKYAFGQDYSLHSVTFPDTLTTIDQQAFQSCYSLESLTIPSGVTSIASSAFSGCYSLRSVIIPNTLTSINQNVLSGCYSLRSVIIPNTITSIGQSSFSACYSIQSITIPSSVTSIGDSAFSSCYSLYTVTLLPTTPPTLGTSVFSTTYTKKIYVPYSVDHSVLAAYQSATNWSNYASIMEELPQS